MNDLLNITICDGKYTVIQSHEGHLRALRNGEEWRDLTGDKLVLALAQEIVALREALMKERVVTKLYHE